MTQERRINERHPDQPLLEDWDAPAPFNLLTEADFDAIWNELGGMDAWLKNFGYFQFGFKVQNAILSRLAASPAPASPVAQQDERATLYDNQQATEAWACVRKHNHSIPSEALDSMLQVLRAALSPKRQDAQGQKDEMVIRKATLELSLPRLVEELEAVEKLGCDYTLSSGVCGMLFRALTAPSVSTGGSIDTPEFRARLRTYHDEASYGSLRQADNDLIAHIVAHVATKVQAARDEALNDAANVAENFGPARPIVTPNPSIIIRGRWEGEQAASSNIATAIRALRSPAATEDKGDQQ